MTRVLAETRRSTPNLLSSKQILLGKLGSCAHIGSLGAFLRYENNTQHFRPGCLAQAPLPYQQIERVLDEDSLDDLSGYLKNFLALDIMRLKNLTSRSVSCFNQEFISRDTSIGFELTETWCHFNLPC